MGITFTRKGYIQVLRDGVVLSEHVEERKAVQSLSEREDGDYVLRYPDVAVTVILRKSDTTPPAVPSDFSASAATATSVTLTLTANVESDFSNYVLERSSDNIGWGYLKSFTGTSTTDTVDVSGSTYYYRAFSIDTRGNRSAYTAVKSAGPYTVNLAWNGTIPNVTFTRGNAQNFDLSPYIIGASPTITVETGTLPAGVTLNSSLQRLQYDGTSATSTSIVATGISLRLSTSAQADWNTRISGSSVVWYHSFDSDDEVNNFRWTDQVQGGNDPLDVSQTGMCIRDATAGVDGGGALRLRYRIGTTPYQAPAWLRPFSALSGGTTTGNGRGVDDPAANGTLTVQTGWNPRTNSSVASQWTKGFYGHSTYASADPTNFDGTEYYLQYRYKVSSNRYLSGTPSAGKSLYLDTPDGSQQEIVIQNNFAKWWGAYRSFSPQIAGPNNAVQYGSQWPNCGILDPPSTYCFLIQADIWHTFLVRIRLGLDGTSTTLMDVKVALPGETTYTQLFNYDQIPMPYSVGQKKGHNCVKASNYMNNVASSYEWYQWYDQIIFSKASIPCPQV